MKKSLLIILSLLSVLALASCKNQKEPVPPEELCLDIQKIQMDMEYSALKEFYDPEPFEVLKADVLAGKADKIECIYRLKEIISSYHVFHLALQTTQDNKDFGSVIIPFYIMLYGKDYHLYAATEEYKQYLGSKLLEIAGLPMQEVIERLSKYGSYETPSGKQYCLSHRITVNTMKRAGLAEKNGSVKIKIQNKDGEIKIVKCKPVEALKSRFYAVQPTIENPLFTFQDMNSYYGIKASQEKKTVYVHLNTINGDSDYLFTDLFKDLMTELKKNLYEIVVFDLRYNGGGKASYASLLTNLLSVSRQELEKYNLALVTSGNTYSAACWFINDFLMFFPKTVIFGEETGQAIYNYTDIYFSNILKTLQCEFIFPQGLDTANEYLIKRAREVTHSDIHRGTLPDVEVYENFEDFMKGEDTIYNAIYDYFDGLPRSQ